MLGRYRLLRRLGSGGFGEVWSAHDELLHREVAVKRILLGPNGDSERATREALAAARLAHPAIVALYEACAVDDAFYLISELVDGDTLAGLIAHDELEDEEVLEIGLALAAALSHAHARGVIHRDIKPQNVLVPNRPEGPAGAAKLTDFGGASLAGEDALTRTGDVLGTLAYMAPEQSEGREVAEEADLYSLALVLYEALSGVNPVRGATPAATARRIGEPIESLGRARRDLPRELTEALDTALAPGPADRGTLTQLRESLEDALERGLGGSRLMRRMRPRGRAPAVLPPADMRPQPDGPRRAFLALAAPEPATRGRAAVLESDEDHAPLEAELQGTRASRGAIPRAWWMGCCLAVVVWQALAGRPGVALLLLAGCLPLLALPRRAGPSWLACALAPLLGLAGLAGAYPALAGQARGWRERAALGAMGYWWLRLAEPLLGHRLWLGAPSGTPARAAWEGSLQTSATHVVWPVLGTGLLLGAALWGVGSLALPWLVRGRSAGLDAVAAVMWSAAMVTAAPLLDGGLSSHATHPSPHGAVLGAVLAAMLAVGARALRGPA
ncbi:MAG TPA: serine/threonine-protein kinase [Gemmatimonadales bacterium]|nr:serine/threonine-protein kinase [Gemmatimonadales bacterium]